MTARLESGAFLGIDIGLSGVRACVIDGAGAVVATSSAPLAPTLCTGSQRWLQTIVATVSAACAASNRSVDAVQVSAYGPVPVLVDRLGRATFVGSVTSARTPAEQVRSALEAGTVRLLDSSGAPLVETDLAGFVVGHLIGRPVLDHVSAVDHAGSPLPLADRGDAGESAGGVTTDAARHTGLRSGTPVGHGSIDSWIDLHALGVIGPGHAGLLLGSTLVIGVIVDNHPAASADAVGLRQCRHLGHGCFLGGWTSAAGSAIDWVDDVTAESEPLELLPPGSGGLLALAHLSGERAPIWDDDARGALVGLTASTTAGDIRRAMVDAVALSALDLADRLGDLGRRPERWSAAGGGFRRAALGAAVCDALGQEIDVAELGDGRAAARSAAQLVGVDVPPPELGTLVPDRTRHERFRALAAIRAGLAELLAPTSHALAALASPSPSHLPGSPR